MDKIKVRNVLIAVSQKENIDELIEVLSDLKVKIWATEGTAKYIKSKGFEGKSIVAGFDFEGRVKSLDRVNLARVLADKSKPKHIAELKRLGVSAFDAVVVELYKLDKKNFPESMDIGGVTLIRAAIKNFESVGLAYDKESIDELTKEVKSNDGSISLKFRKKQAKKAAKFIAERCKLESENISDL